MDNGSVLNIHLVAYGNLIDISTNHGIKPHAAFYANEYIAYYRGIFGYITIFWNLRRFASHWLNDHSKKSPE
jgi:hypothetical protein